MPRVPVYDPQVRIQRLPGVQQSAAGATPDAFGAGVGESLERAGKTGLAISLEMKERQDTDAAQEAYRKAYDELRIVLKDENKGLLVQTGDNARDVTEKGDAKIAQIRDKHMKGLSPAAASAFDKFWDSTRRSSLDVLAGHEASEYRKASQINRSAITEDFLDQAVSAYKTPSAFREAIDGMAATIRSSIVADGMPVTEISRNTQEATGKAVSAIVLRNLQEDDVDTAEQILKAWGKKIDSKVVGDLERNIQDASSLVQAQQAVGQVISKMPSASLVQQISALEKSGLKGQTLEKGKILLRARVQDMENDRRNYERVQLGRVYAMAVDPGMTFEEKMKLAQQSPEAVRNNAVRMVYTMNAKAASDMERSEEYAAMEEIRRRVDSGIYQGDGEVAKAASDIGLRDKSDISRLVDYYRGGGIVSLVKETDIDAAYLRVTGKPRVKGKYATLHDEVVSRLPGGEKPKREDIDKIVTELMRSGELNRGDWTRENFYSPNKKYIEVVGTEEEANFDFDIPANIVKQIDAEIEAQAKLDGGTRKMWGNMNVSEIRQKIYREKYIPARQR